MRFMQKKTSHNEISCVREYFYYEQIFDKNYVNFNFQNFKNKFYKV